VTEPALVIGYGNELRRDDGAGPRVCRELEARRPAGVRVRIVHQLTPELAEPLADARIAVFVDAAAGQSAVRCGPVAESGGVSALAHTGGPAWLLGLAEATFGRRPQAWLVTVPAEDFGFGTGLSPDAERYLSDAVAEVERLLGEPAGA
jgi:hydrogenase maturation protease